MLTVRKREGESATGLMYRFNKRVKQSGLIKEVRKRRFTHRKTSGLKVKLSALHREAAKKEYQHKKKMGLA
jgi:ribosomal protein S21